MHSMKNTDLTEIEISDQVFLKAPLSSSTSKPIIQRWGICPSKIPLTALQHCVVIGVAYTIRYTGIADSSTAKRRGRPQVRIQATNALSAELKSFCDNLTSVSSVMNTYHLCLGIPN